MMPTWQSMGSWGSLMFIWAMLQQFIPYRFFRRFFEKYTRKIESYFDPYIRIRFDEYCFNDALSERERSTAYVAIQHYLETNSSCKARRLKANPVKNSQTLVLGMDDYEEITDEYQGITVWWTSMKTVSGSMSTLGDDKQEQQRYYTLNFHGRYRDLITKSYMQHVLTQGKAISVEKRERKLKELKELLAKAKEEEELLAKAKEEEQLKAKKEKVQDNGRRFISSKRCCFL
ncbi:hypothetical protein POM88_009910 [Heracleum sosnowskyi]|uniref:AAA-type ATPase N-terminal domain-containing protein n=1 Tax=Heracleum sosnowskyi TaxID=360622 RepID=A0AAD8JCS2_9APIA|nr:hypothetical protein POM88_009910 [Heracleum sosnowskyi]